MTQPTKILLFMPNLAGGGAERVALNLSREFGRRGVGVLFVILENRIGDRYLETILGGPV